MAWVYMLKGSTGRYYIGSTTDMDRRMEEHRRGHTYTTRRLGELELVAKLETPTLAEARALERKLKQKKNPAVALYLLQSAGSPPPTP
jgi:putative endonuclease